MRSVDKWLFTSVVELILSSFNQGYSRERLRVQVEEWRLERIYNYSLLPIMAFDTAKLTQHRENTSHARWRRVLSVSYSIK